MNRKTRMSDDVVFPICDITKHLRNRLCFFPVAVLEG